MIPKTLLLAALPLAVSFAAVAPRVSSTSSATATTTAVHCQVPCGIYGDSMRIDMLMEDAATIEKGMAMITELEGSGAAANQLVRWIVTKDQHAQAIQDTVAEYWLAQRIKAPKEDSEKAREHYHRQLELMHGITVAAMKCKQTTDPANVETLRSLALDFSATYFDDDTVKHILEHYGR